VREKWSARSVERSTAAGAQQGWQVRGKGSSSSSNSSSSSECAQIAANCCKRGWANANLALGVSTRKSALNSIGTAERDGWREQTRARFPFAVSIARVSRINRRVVVDDSVTASGKFIGDALRETRIVRRIVGRGSRSTPPYRSGGKFTPSRPANLLRAILLFFFIFLSWR